MSRLARALGAAALACALHGCATGASAKGMTVTPADLTAPANAALAGAIGLGEVTGGKETNPLWISEIGTVEFGTALAESLRVAGLLAAGAGARYQLRALLVDTQSPIFGFDMTVTVKIHYRLTEVASGKVVLEQLIVAAHTATMGDAFYGPTRLQLANEGAARKSIAALLQALAGLSLAGAVSLL